jgi:hypothetical protein
MMMLVIIISVPDGLLNLLHHGLQRMSEAARHRRNLLLVVSLVDEKGVDEIPDRFQDERCKQRKEFL